MDSLKTLIVAVLVLLLCIVVLASLYIGFRFINTKVTALTKTTEVIVIENQKFLIVNTSSGVAVVKMQ